MSCNTSQYRKNGERQDWCFDALVALSFFVRVRVGDLFIPFFFSPYILLSYFPPLFSSLNQPPFCTHLLSSNIHSRFTQQHQAPHSLLLDIFAFFITLLLISDKTNSKKLRRFTCNFYATTEDDLPCPHDMDVSRLDVVEKPLQHQDMIIG